jgi:uncharacterized protein (TIGR02118 family)
MVRLIALYSVPDDPDAFDEHYRNVHTPIIDRYPGLREMRVARIAGVGSRGAPYHLMAEMIFDSREDLDAALASDAGIESGRDLRNFAQAGVSLFVATDEQDG